MNYKAKYKDLLKKAKQDSYFITPEESLGISSDEYNEIVDECIFGDDKEPQVDGFDAELNALLKKYEHLPKKELQEPLEFYLGIVRDDLDVVRENPTKHVGWVNIFKCGLCYSVWGNIYPTKEDALNDIGGDEGDVYITTIKIEWEE